MRSVWSSEECCTIGHDEASEQWNLRNGSGLIVIADVWSLNNKCSTFGSFQIWAQIFTKEARQLLHDQASGKTHAVDSLSQDFKTDRVLDANQSSPQGEHVARLLQSAHILRTCLG